MTRRHNIGNNKDFDNEYPGPGNSYIYVAGFVHRNHLDVWEGGTFSDNELLTIEPSPDLGIVLSYGAYSSGIDHAPDAVYVLCSLGLVPDGVNHLLCVDRRGLEDAAPAYINRLVDGGAVVVYDANPESPFTPIIPADWLEYHVEWTPRYNSEIRYAGPLSGLSDDAWAACHESWAAGECRHIQELLEEGGTSRYELESADPVLAKLAVAQLGRGRVKPPAKVVPWAKKGMEALCWRDDLSSLKIPGHGADMLAVARIWDAQLNRRKFKPHKASRVAKIWGVDAMLDAYVGGVPIEDIVA